MKIHKFKSFRLLLEGLSELDLNEILDKISKSGLGSLSEHEKTLLKSYSDADIDVDVEIQKHQNKFKNAKNIINDLGFTYNIKTALHDNIGRYIRYNDTEKGGLIQKYGTLFEIIAVQKHWGRDENGAYVPDRIGYRVAEIGKDNCFGRVAGVDDVTFVDISEVEAIEINKVISAKINKELDI